MALPKEKGVTYADYKTWGDAVRCEVLDGIVISYNFSPSPQHQIVLGNLHFLFRGYFEGKSCDVMMAPCDVYLFADETGPTDDNQNFVEPDLFVLCGNQTKGDKGIYGAPEFVFEVLWPSHPKNDKIYKLRKYKQAGVKEYWIVDPNYEVVDVYLFEDGRFSRSRSYASDEIVEVHLFEGLSIDLSKIFTE